MAWRRVADGWRRPARVVRRRAALFAPTAPAEGDHGDAPGRRRRSTTSGPRCPTRWRSSREAAGHGGPWPPLAAAAEAAEAALRVADADLVAGLPRPAAPGRRTSSPAGWPAALRAGGPRCDAGDPGRAGRRAPARLRPGRATTGRPGRRRPGDAAAAAGRRRRRRRGRRRGADRRRGQPGPGLRPAGPGRAAGRGATRSTWRRRSTPTSGAAAFERARHRGPQPAPVRPDPARLERARPARLRPGVAGVDVGFVGGPPRPPHRRRPRPRPLARRRRPGWTSGRTR